VPTGAGEAVSIDTGGVEIYGAAFVDEKHIIYGRPSATDDGADSVYFQEIGGPSRVLVSDIQLDTGVVSFDGTRVAVGERGKISVYPIDGGDAVTYDGLDPMLGLVQWSDDGHYFYLSRYGVVPAEVLRYDLRSGELEPWRELMPESTTGVVRIDEVQVSRDGRRYAYSALRMVSSALYVVEGASF
jgi:hypothetical protein